MSAMKRSARRIGSQIERHTRVSRQHLTPELRLRLLLPECPLYSARAQQAQRYFGPNEPFWAIYWPGGQALARYILDEGARLFSERPRRVLDLGAGCGAAGIAAKITGAHDVLVNDIDEVACIAAAKNAWLNGVKVRLSTDDLIGRELPEPFDLLLIGDLLYDEEIARRLESWLDEMRPECEILLADPGRHGLTERLRRKLVHLRTYRLPDNVRRENYGYDEAAVWKFLPGRGS